MHDNPNVGQLEGVEPALTSILLDNLVHTGNNLLPNYSNTKTVQAAEPELEPVALPPQEAADLLP
jgi:hypothetical protein